MKSPYARFVADPSKLRVSTRMQRDGSYKVTITIRAWTPVGAVRSVSCTRHTPPEAVSDALRAAERAGFPGLNLDGEWAYDHPWANA